MGTRMHQLFRRSVTTGKCEDCGLVDDHSNACLDAAPIRQIEALYDKLDKLNLQNRDLTEALKKETEALERSVAREDATFRLVERLQKMLNEIRGYVIKTAYGPGEHEIEGQILRIIEDAPSEKR